MKLSQLSVSTLFLVGLALAGPLASPLAEPFNERGITEDSLIEDLIWEGPANPDGTKVTLRGTIEQIHEQIKSINPEYDLTYDDNQTNATDVSSDLTKRYDSLYCNTGQNAAAKGRIEQGISYLKRVKAACNVAGQSVQSCVRISCSYDSAIFLCNRTGRNLSLGCNNLAADAQAIVDRCSSGYQVTGVAYSSEYYVSIRNDKC